MRFSIIPNSLATGVFILATGVFAADNIKPVTYLEGNLDGFSTQATGTLEFRNSKVMVLHTKDKDAEIPYSVVSKTSQKVIPVVVEKKPLYEVWALPMRLVVPTPLHAVTVVYKDNAGAEKSLVLSMDKAAADRVEAQVKQVADRSNRDAGVWWGDGVWKTARNKDQWGGAGVVAQRE